MTKEQTNQIIINDYLPLLPSIAELTEARDTAQHLVNVEEFELDNLTGGEMLMRDRFNDMLQEYKAMRDALQKTLQVALLINSRKEMEGKEND